MRFTAGQSGIGRWVLAIVAMVFVVFVVVALNGFPGDSLKRRYSPPGSMVSIGTHRLHLYCAGSERPSVIIEPGIGSGWETWRSVVPELTRFSRVCVYDRSGYGWSDPSPDGATASQLAGELRSLLVNGHVPAPYIVVAHSFGAYIARLYANRFPGGLLGLVLVDPADEDEPHEHSFNRTVHNLIPASGLPGLVPLFEGERALPPFLGNAPAAFRHRFLVGISYNEGVAARRELASLTISETEARAARLPRNLPLSVITAPYLATTDRVGQPEMPNAPRHFEVQASLARLSDHGWQTVAANSGHFVQLDRPDLIVRSVRQLIDCCLAELHPEGEADRP